MNKYEIKTLTSIMITENKTYHITANSKKEAEHIFAKEISNIQPFEIIEDDEIVGEECIISCEELGN